MKAAVVNAAGALPIFMEFDDPREQEGLNLVEVSASALSRVARSKAAGSHYSSKGGFPFVAGIDGVGRLADGQRVYFFGPQAPFGAIAERTVVSAATCVPLPDAIDDVTAAAIAIPAMSSWAALTERARFTAGETVLVNGATGASGRLAVQIAKHLGAAKVIATGRNAQTLDALRRAGADVTIPLMQDDKSLSAAFEQQFRDGVDVVLDYLWGPSARALLVAAAKTLEDGQPLRVVQIGSIGGGEIELPGAVLRAAAITLMGSGIGSVPLPRLLHAVSSALQAVAPAGLRIDTEAIPLADVAQHWERADSLVRTVFVTR